MKIFNDAASCFQIVLLTLAGPGSITLSLFRENRKLQFVFYASQEKRRNHCEIHACLADTYLAIDLFRYFNSKMKMY